MNNFTFDLTLSIIPRMLKLCEGTFWTTSTADEVQK